MMMMMMIKMIMINILAYGDISNMTIIKAPTTITTTTIIITTTITTRNGQIVR